MRILFIFFSLVCTIINCFGQDNYGTKFYNVDGSQNAYFIDTLHIDSLVIVRSKKNGHFFAIRNPNKKSLKGKIWNLSNVYLYNTECFGSWCLRDMPVTAIPNEIYGTSLNGGVLFDYYPYSESTSYQIVNNYQTPKYYWLVMIRGDAYNFLTVRSVFDSGCKVISFKNEKAYYKLLIPIW